MEDTSCQRFEHLVPGTHLRTYFVRGAVKSVASIFECMTKGNNVEVSTPLCGNFAKLDITSSLSEVVGGPPLGCCRNVEYKDIVWLTAE